tara:strand:- start:5811 stop:6458 length:648 start_codon:yes stop_codon:yes gene_type:complete
MFNVTNENFRRYFKMLKVEELSNTLERCANNINNKASKRVEHIVQEALMTSLGGKASKEVPLKEIGAEQAWGGVNGRLDVLHEGHGIEIKVVQFPRIKAVASNALYDIGQISSDYWRLRSATGLKSSELVILLQGPLVGFFTKEIQVLREFHNRMFVDFETSTQFGELSKQVNAFRECQKAAIIEMGFDKPFNRANGKKIVTHKGLALLSIPVKI